MNKIKGAWPHRTVPSDCDLHHHLYRQAPFQLTSLSLISIWDESSTKHMMMWPWWRHQMETFSRYWSPVNSPHKGRWRGALMFSSMYAWINDWVNNREAGDLSCHYDVTLMTIGIFVKVFTITGPLCRESTERSPVTGPLTGCFDAFYIFRFNKLLNEKKSGCRPFAIPWRSCDVIIMW